MMESVRTTQPRKIAWSSSEKRLMGACRRVDLRRRCRVLLEWQVVGSIALLTPNATSAPPPEQVEVRVTIPQGVTSTVVREDGQPADRLQVQLVPKELGSVEIRLLNFDHSDVLLEVIEDPNTIDNYQINIKNQAPAGGDTLVMLSFLRGAEVGAPHVLPPRSGAGIGTRVDFSPAVQVTRPLVIPAGEVPDGEYLPGPELRIEKQITGDLKLDWGRSCSEKDVDYEVYEGSIGSWDDYHVVSCTTKGLTEITIPLDWESHFFLVVPRSKNREGSYGRRGDGSQRSPAADACLKQEMTICKAEPASSVDPRSSP